MSAWLTVFCTRSIDQITAADLRSELAVADLYTVAEGFGIEDEEIVDEAESQLSLTQQDDNIRFFLEYGEGKRPVPIYVSDASSVPEALDELSEREGAAADRVRDILRQTVQQFSLSLGVSNFEDMGIVLAALIAEHLASVGEGVIRDQNDDWWVVEDRVPRVILEHDH